VKQILKRMIKGETQVMPTAPVFPGGIHEMGNFKPDDVFIVGFPKSGNTLMQHLIAHLYYGGNGEISRSMVNLMCPDIYANTHYFRVNDTCFFKSHELPKPHHKRVIYLVRDGRDALVSYKNMLNKQSIDVNLDDLYTGEAKVMGTTWHDHIKAWMTFKEACNDFMIVKYEDLVSNKIMVLQNICKFLNIERTDLELSNVEKYTSIDHMKSLEKRTDWMNMRAENGFKKNANFIHKGEIGNHTKTVSDDIKAIFEKKAMDALKLFNYI